MPDVEKVYKSQVGNSHQAGLQAVYDAGLAEGRALATAEHEAAEAAIPVPKRRAEDVEQKDPEQERAEVQETKGKKA
jgi:hypothetical protein